MIKQANNDLETTINKFDQQAVKRACGEWEFHFVEGNAMLVTSLKYHQDISTESTASVFTDFFDILIQYYLLNKS